MKKSEQNYAINLKTGINKLLRIMKLTYFMLMINILATSAAGYSQTAKVSLDLKDASLKEILTEIEAQTDLSFIYKSDLVDASQKVDIQTTDASIEQVLAFLFSERNIRCEIMDKSVIVLLPKDNSSAQQIKISGVVTDALNGDPLPGVYILIEGTSQGVITGNDGSFTIDVPSKTSVLLFSFVGYISQRIEVSDQSIINVSLEMDVTNLEEIVVVGYGTTRKATATGAVTTTKGSEILKSPAANVSNNLIGRLPGVVSVTRSGEPGYDGSTLRIRGSNTLGDNSPLVVVDGIANRSMERIDPSDIESITVLKDASAAIYGAQAANGVILITTRRGQVGKPQITLSVNGGYNRPTRIPEMADAAQYATMLNEIKYYGNPSAGKYQLYTEEDIRIFSDGSDPWGHPNTDWFEEVFRKRSNQNYQNVSISGGSENMKYYLSFGHRFQDGVYKNSATNYRQYDFRSNIDGRISKNIDISFDVAGRQENKNFPTVSAGNTFRMLMRGKPNMVAYWPNGMPGPDIEYGYNPAVTSTDATGYDKDRQYVLESNVRLDIKIPWLSGLSVTANGSFDKAFRFHKTFRKPWYLYTWNGNPEHELVKGKRGLDTPELTENAEDGYRITYNAYATYEKILSEVHNFKVMAGTERFQGYKDYLSAFRRNFISDAVDQMFAGASDTYMTNGGYAEQSARMNYFGRVNYDYAQKYLAEFVWRYDGSYMFPEGKRFGFFPGISLGWRISDENFWKNNIDFINNFKLRASWGQTGNDRISEYQYLSTYGYLSNRSYVFNGNEEYKVLNELRTPNPNVTWEVANQSNIGFESLFFNRLTVEFDYFYNKRTDILWRRSASVPTSTGLTLPPENIGEVVNRGVDFVVGYRNNIGKLEYDISTNGSYAKNKVTFWDETPGIPEYQKSTGKPMPTRNSDGTYASDLYYQAIGIFNDEADVNSYPHLAGARPGDIIFQDYNNDGVIDDLDRVRDDRNNMPRFTGGVSINLRYGQFDASMLVQGAAGARIYLSTESGEIGNYLKEFADNRWTEENPTAEWPRTFNRDTEYWRNRANTFWLRSTDYVRLKTLEIGYDLPSSIEKKLGILGLRLYVNGNNLITFDKCKVFDPELDNGSGQVYPLQKVVNAGFTLTF